MHSSRRTNGPRWPKLAVILGLLIAMTSGCSVSKNQPAQGKVELEAGDVKNLAGSHIEAVHVNDPTVRASGEIQADGSFKLQALREGKVEDKLPPGDYQARILLTDNDPQAARQAAKVVPSRYLRFDSSDLTFQVPSNGEVTLKLSQR